ncbi:MAG: SpoIIE family protein phosphatase [Candidatus Riflebacteria bacterium]|nr:SpoIIE family protein phosphatase [Candidatus Riflebacteria bacterium]
MPFVNQENAGNFARIFFYALAISLFLCGFPLLLLNTALVYLLDLKIKNTERIRFEQLEEKMLQVFPHSKPESFLKEMLTKLMKKAERQKDPLRFLYNVLPRLERKYPDLFTFNIFDKNDKLLVFRNQITLRTVKEKFLLALRDLYSTGSHHAVKEQGFTREVFSSFLGISRDFTTLIKTISTGWVTCSNGQKNTWFYHHLSQNFSVFANVHKRGTSPIMGIRKYVYSKNKSDVQIALVDMHLWKVFSDNEIESIIQEATANYDRTPQSSFTFKNRLFSVSHINSRYMLVTTTTNDYPKFAEKAIFFSRLFSILLLVLTFILTLHLLSQKTLPYLSIRLKMIFLFLFSSAVPLILLAFTAIAYLGEREKFLINDALQQSEKTLRELDARFPFAGRACETQLQNICKNAEISSVEGFDKFRKELINFKRRYKCESIVLQNSSGTEVDFNCPEITKNMNKETRIVKSSLLHNIFIEYCANENITIAKPESLKKTEAITSFSGFDPEKAAKDFIGFEGFLSPIDFGPNHYIVAFNVIRSNSTRPTHMLYISWDKKSMMQHHLSRSISFKPLDDGSELLAVRMTPFFQPVQTLNPHNSRQFHTFRRVFPCFPEKQFTNEFMNFFRSFILTQRISSKIITYKGSPYIVSALPGQYFENIGLFVFKPLSSIKSEVKSLSFRLILFAFLSLGFTSTLGIFLSRKFLLPVHELSKGIENLQGRNFTYRIPQLDNDEFGSLAVLFNKMTESFDEINMGRLVQERLFPSRMLDNGKYGIFGFSRPYSDLGGDYYDYLSINEKSTVAIIGDVTGHGIPAAIVMAMIKAIVTHSASGDVTADSLLLSLNKMIYSTVNISRSKRLMMTLCLVWINLETDQLVISNCGHTFPFRQKTDGTVEMIETSGILLGMRAKPIYSPLTITLNQGERLFFYTDGLAESLSGIESSGFAILGNYLASRPKLPLEAACRDILENHPLIKSGEHLTDDFTIMMIERK